MKKFGTRVIAAVLTSAMIVLPVYAAPSIDELKEQKQKAQQEVNSLQSRLTEIVGKIDSLERELIRTGEEIQTVTKDLADAKEKEKNQYEDMKVRIKYMYEEGNTTALEVLMSSADFADLLNKAEYVQNIHSYDRQKLEEYVETKKKVSNLKTKLEKEQKNLEKMQSEYTAQENELNVMIDEKSSEIEDIGAQIQEAVAEAARRAEAEERARREAEERAAAERQQAQQDDGQPAEQAEDADADTDGGDDADTADTGNDSAQEPVKQEESAAENSGGGNSSAAQTIVSVAYSMCGVPYVWGGSSPSGFDCSGLVMYCHRAAGISLAHSSGSQGSGGKSVSSPQPGDVVCYSGHVGIYIGGGQMIHAPHTGDVVRVAAVYGSPWYRRYW